MLASSQNLARVLKRTRLKLGMSQAEAARRLDVSPAWLCQVERGVRAPSRRLAQSLEPVYGVRNGTFQKRYRFAPRGREPMSANTGKALREILAAVPIESQEPSPRTPFPVPYGWKDWRGGTESATWPIGVHLGPAAQDEVELLEARRPEDDRFWKLLNGLPFDSWTEKRFLVKLGLAGGDLVRVAPRRMGARARCIDTSGHDASRRPQVAMVLAFRNLSVAVWPQRVVRGHRQVWKLDALAVVARNGRKVTVNIELDGPQHTPEQNYRRQRDLRLPTLRYPAAVVNAPGFVGRLLADCAHLLEP